MGNGLMSTIEDVKKLVDESNNIVFFGGAGVSTGSGIADFRSETGLYNRENNTNYSPEYMLSHSFFKENPEAFTRYYKENLIVKEARPNKAHLGLAKLEKRGKLKGIITQNIDGLHQKAGSENVIEIHGNLEDYYCVDCYKTYDQDFILKDNSLNTCEDCGGIIRPDVVLYEEQLDMNRQIEAIDLISKADVFIVGGSSLVVYPAAGYLNYYNNNKLILINRDSTPQDRLANYIINDDIGRVLEYLVGTN